MCNEVLTIDQINNAIKPRVWDFGNQILYDMCRNNPCHTKDDVMIAKIMIIGRTYSAAIERRKTENNIGNDNFYTTKVAPKIRQSGIDTWFDSIRYMGESTEEKKIVLETHCKLMRLFLDISGQKKRSLASKYLHFHFPEVFFIYDSRAVEAMRHFSKITERVGRIDCKCDNEYRKFYEKCLKLRMHIVDKFQMTLSPRQLDNLLLDTFEN